MKNNFDLAREYIKYILPDVWKSMLILMYILIGNEIKIFKDLSLIFCFINNISFSFVPMVE